MSRTGKVFCFILIFSMVLSFMAMGASASNWTDTREQFAGPINGEYTEFRRKEDSTPCYINNNRSNCTLAVLTCGALNSRGTDPEDLSYDYTDGSVGGCYHYLQPGDSKYMGTVIHEYGYTYAGLRVFANDPYDYNYYADFLWSPDSIGG